MTYQWPRAPIVNATGANAPACTCQPVTYLLVPVTAGEPDGAWFEDKGRHFRPTIHHESAYRLVGHRGDCLLTDEVWYKDRRIM